MKGEKLRGDVVVNLVFAVIKAAALVWMIRVAAAKLPAVELGLFLLARRVSGTGANLLQAGGAQTLLRYIPLHGDEPRARRNYAVFALSSWAVVAAVGTVVSAIISDRMAWWLFPGRGGAGLAFWTAMLLLAMVLDFFVRGVLIAERRMMSANLVELMTGSGFVLAALWLSTSDVTGFLRFQTLSVVALCGVVASFIVARAPRGQWPDRREWAAIGRTFAVYGLPRGLITFLDMGLLLIGPWLLRADAARAAHLIIALSVLQLFAAAIGPVAQVAMVVTARLAGRDNVTGIREGIRLLVGALLYTVLPLFAFVAPWTSQVTRLWLGNAALAAGVVSQVAVLMWAVLPFSLFQGLKGVVEAYWVRPYNLYSLLMAYLAFLMLFLVLPGEIAGFGVVALALVVAFWVVGLATVFWLRTLLPTSAFIAWPRLSILVLAVGVTNLFLERSDGILALVAATLISAVVVAAFVRFVPTPFTKECEALVWQPRQPL